MERDTHMKTVLNSLLSQNMDLVVCQLPSFTPEMCEVMLDTEQYKSSKVMKSRYKLVPKDEFDHMRIIKVSESTMSIMVYSN